MCMSDEPRTQQQGGLGAPSSPHNKKIQHESPPPLRASSTVSSTSESITSSSSSSGGNMSDDEWNDSQLKQTAAVFIDGAPSSASTASSDDSSAVESSSSSILPTLLWLVCGSGVAAGLFAFSLWFPHTLAPHAASETYHWAVFSYDKETSHFDNTVWTYGTDYGLAVIMASLASYIIWTGHNTVAQNLCWKSASLLLLYCVSVTAGGYSHQNFLTLESRNTVSFRIWWTVCVGTVTFASTAMGMSGTQVLRQYQDKLKRQERLRPVQQHGNFGCLKLLQSVPILPDSFWIAFGLVITGICVMGGMSYQRPACDIFIAGITQSPSTFYVMIFFGLIQHKHVENYAKIVGLVGFILNAPLLPMYPLLVQYTDWSLASVNTLLHSWLCVAWSLQGISMHHVAKALILEEQEASKTDKKNN